MRQLIYDTLQADAAIVAEVGADGVYSTYEVVPPTPFIVVRMSLARDRGVPAYSQFFQVWAHDAPGDYARIDSLLDRAKVVLEALPNEGSLFEVSWIEDSHDVPLEVSTGTIARYSRYQHTSRR